MKTTTNPGALTSNQIAALKSATGTSSEYGLFLRGLVTITEETRRHYRTVRPGHRVLVQCRVPSYFATVTGAAILAA